MIGICLVDGVGILSMGGIFEGLDTGRWGCYMSWGLSESRHCGAYSG